MRAIDRARIWAIETGADFEGLVSHCMAFGYVFIEPDFILLGEDRGDTWFVYLLVGSPRYAMATAPAPKKWIEFERVNPDGSSRSLRIPWTRLENWLED